ncbi:MAG TPA: serine/threonine-protein kinase, partial [Labilithrix sp.]
LAHPHIVQVTDLVQPDEGAPFLVMELLEGESLAERLARERRIDASRAALIAVQVLSALAAAHAAGIVHRDVKPANVFLARTAATNDFVKLLDFGVARVSHGSPGSVTSARLVGTPAYMAPEQIRGESADARTDVYAVGVCLYEMLSGRSPFTATNVPSLLVKICGTEADALADVSAELAAVVTRAMSKDAATRYANADAMRVALVPFAASAPVPSRAISPPARLSPEKEAAITVPLAAPEAASLAETRPTPLVPPPVVRTHVSTPTLASGEPASQEPTAPPAAPPSSLRRWGPLAGALAVTTIAMAYPAAAEHAPEAAAVDAGSSCTVAPEFISPIDVDLRRLSIAGGRDDFVFAVSAAPTDRLIASWRGEPNTLITWPGPAFVGNARKRTEDAGALDDDRLFVAASTWGTVPILVGVRTYGAERARRGERALLTIDASKNALPSLSIPLPQAPSQVAVAAASPWTLVATVSPMLVPLGDVVEGSPDMVVTDVLRGRESFASRLHWTSSPPRAIHAAASPSLLVAVAQDESEIAVHLYGVTGDKLDYATSVIAEGASRESAVTVVGDVAVVVWISDDDGRVRWARVRRIGGVDASGTILDGVG